jgi:hypothetical protein
MAGAGDPAATRVDRIFGWTIPAGAGMNIHAAPHELGPEESQLLENTRWQGMYLAPRGGQGAFQASSPAGAGYFLWGVYGEVIQHGGIGGAGFLDDPDPGFTPDEGEPGFGLFWTEA